MSVAARTARAAAARWLAALPWAALLLVAAGCASLPPPEHRSVSTAYVDTAGTRLGATVVPMVRERLGWPKRSFDIVSPYFVPGDDGTAPLVAMAQAGVKVRVLTNSLASSDERIDSGHEIRYDVEPQTDWLKRLGLELLSGLPIDWML